MQYIATLFESASVLLALLAVFILYFLNENRIHANRILAVVLALLSLTAINSAAAYQNKLRTEKLDSHLSQDYLAGSAKQSSHSFEMFHPNPG